MTTSPAQSAERRCHYILAPEDNGCRRGRASCTRRSPPPLREALQTLRPPRSRQAWSAGKHDPDSSSPASTSASRQRSISADAGYPCGSSSRRRAGTPSDEAALFDGCHRHCPYRPIVLAVMISPRIMICWPGDILDAIARWSVTCDAPVAARYYFVDPVEVRRERASPMVRMYSRWCTSRYVDMTISGTKAAAEALRGEHAVARPSEPNSLTCYDANGGVLDRQACGLRRSRMVSIAPARHPDGLGEIHVAGGKISSNRRLSRRRLGVEFAEIQVFALIACSRRRRRRSGVEPLQHSPTCPFGLLLDEDGGHGHRRHPHELLGMTTERVMEIILPEDEISITVSIQLSAMI